MNSTVLTIGVSIVLWMLSRNSTAAPATKAPATPPKGGGSGGGGGSKDPSGGGAGGSGSQPSWFDALLSRINSGADNVADPGVTSYDGLLQAMPTDAVVDPSVSLYATGAGLDALQQSAYDSLSAMGDGSYSGDANSVDTTMGYDSGGSSSSIDYIGNDYSYGTDNGGLA